MFFSNSDTRFILILFVKLEAYRGLIRAKTACSGHIRFFSYGSKRFRPIILQGSSNCNISRTARPFELIFLCYCKTTREIEWMINDGIFMCVHVFFPWSFGFSISSNSNITKTARPFHLVFGSMCCKSISSPLSRIFSFLVWNALNCVDHS